ncbi:MAG TPA: hypothetical protein VFS31_05715, partial [Chitinophagaceae bacterium]|nr:hypothetical protein [Chitinophagaceae bacterium]
VVAIDPSSSIGSGTTLRSKNIYANPLDTGIFVSNDGGGTWSQLDGAPTVVRGMKVASNGTLYVAADNAVFKYTPSSGTWTNITPPDSKRKWGAIDVAPTDPNKIIVTVDRQDAVTNKFRLHFYYSGTGGISWSGNLAATGNYTINYAAPWYVGTGRFAAATACLRFDPVDPKIVYITDWYQVMKTTDITASNVLWNQILRGHEEMVVPDMASFPHPNAGDVQVFSGVADNGGFKHLNFVDYPTGYSSLSPGGRLTTWQAMTGFDFCETYPNYVASSGFQDNGKRGAFFVSNDKGQSFKGLDSLPGVAGKCAYSATDSNLILAIVNKDYKTNPTA